MRRAAVVAGREAEVDTLVRAVERARNGEPSCTLLLGEGGVGKTRLLGEAAAAARRLNVATLSGRAPVAAPAAFSVLTEALRSWLRGHPEAVRPSGSPYDAGLRLVLPEWSAGAPQHQLSQSQLRLLALEGIVQVVREIARADGAVLLLLDDLHAADADSLEAMRYLATAAVESVAVVGALRPGEASLPDEVVRALEHDGTTAVMELAPLDERAVGDLVAALLDADPPADLVTHIVDRTDGVPLLVEEVLDAHLRAGSVAVDGAGARWHGVTQIVPRTIREMVESRLERLPSPERDVVVAGAIVGDFDADLLCDVVPTETAVVSDALVAGMGAGLLETTGGAVGFRHAIIRDAVIDAALPHIVAAVHSKAAAALAGRDRDDTEILERRAEHLVHLNATDDAAALLLAAARLHLRNHALLTAEATARRALHVAAGAEARGAASDALAEVLAAQGRWAEALDIDEATVNQQGETPARMERMALSALEAGQPERARPIIARALAVGDTSAAIRVADGRAALVAGDAEHALECARQVLETTAIDGDLDARLGGLELQGRAFDFLGDRAAAESAWVQQAEEAVAAGRTQAQLRAVVLLGKVELFAGRRPARLHEAVELARAAGALVELGWAEENLGVALAIQGDLPAAQALLEQAVERCRRLRLDQVAYLLVQKAATDSYTTESVDELFAEAERLTPTDDLRLHVAAMRGDLALRRGDYDEAIEHLEFCKRIMEAMPGIVPMDTGWLVWALVAAGRHDDAVRALDDARAVPDPTRWYGRPVVLAAAEALVGGNEAGIDGAVASATGHMPIDIATMRMLAAEVIKGPSRVRWLRESLDLYEAAGATLMVERVRRLLRDAGGPVPRRRRSATGVPEALASHGVTARETEVLRLLGEGLSNAAIAERLFLSVRTIESHVSSLLSKLHVESRGQLTALSATIDFTA